MMLSGTTLTTGESFAVKVEGSDTIDAVKAKIQDKGCIPPEEHLTLILPGNAIAPLDIEFPDPVDEAVKQLEGRTRCPLTDGPSSGLALCDIYRLAMHGQNGFGIIAAPTHPRGSFVAEERQQDPALPGLTSSSARSTTPTTSSSSIAIASGLKRPRLHDTDGEPSSTEQSNLPTFFDPERPIVNTLTPEIVEARIAAAVQRMREEMSRKHAEELMRQRANLCQQFYLTSNKQREFFVDLAKRDREWLKNQRKRDREQLDLELKRHNEECELKRQNAFEQYEKWREESEKQNEDFNAIKAHTEKLREESEKQNEESEKQKEKWNALNARMEKLREESDKQKEESEKQKEKWNALNARMEKLREESDKQKEEFISFHSSLKEEWNALKADVVKRESELANAVRSFVSAQRSCAEGIEEAHDVLEQLKNSLPR